MRVVSLKVDDSGARFIVRQLRSPEGFVSVLGRDFERFQIGRQLRVDEGPVSGILAHQAFEAEDREMAKRSEVEEEMRKAGLRCKLGGPQADVGETVRQRSMKKTIATLPEPQHKVRVRMIAKNEVQNHRGKRGQRKGAHFQSSVADSEVKIRPRSDEELASEGFQALG